MASVGRHCVDFGHEGAIMSIQGMALAVVAPLLAQCASTTVARVFVVVGVALALAQLSVG